MTVRTKLDFTVVVSWQAMMLAAMNSSGDS